MGGSDLAGGRVLPEIFWSSNVISCSNCAADEPASSAVEAYSSWVATETTETTEMTACDSSPPVFVARAVPERAAPGFAPQSV
jgi:hypothetical protein